MTSFKFDILGWILNQVGLDIGLGSCWLWVKVLMLDMICPLFVYAFIVSSVYLFRYHYLSLLPGMQAFGQGQGWMIYHIRD